MMLITLALLSVSLLHEVAAHGGGLHRWTFRKDVAKVIKTADVRYDAHVEIGTCSDWVSLNMSAVSKSYPLPYFPDQMGVNMSVEGDIKLYTYLGGGNCTQSPQSGLFPKLKFTTWQYVGKTKGKGKWVASYPKDPALTWGYAFTGPCTAPGNIYRNNVTLQDDRFNMLFWNAEHGYIGEGMNRADRYPGWVWGATVNAWFPMVTAEKRIQSIVVVTQGSVPKCCTVDYSGYAAPESVLEKGHVCDVVGGHRK